MVTRLRIFVTTVGLALSGAVTATPARAAVVDDRAAATGWAKKEAIIGQPSALEAIVAAQSGRTIDRRGFQPASLSRPVIAGAAGVERRGDEGATSKRPDVFGSIALSVDRTPLDWRWRRAGLAGITGAPARFASALSSKQQVARLEAVNGYVNDRVDFVDDQVQFGRADVWASAAGTLSRGKGDCEDYAIAKLQMLRMAGFSDRDLYLVIVRDLVRRADHAVLVARAEGRMYVLDSGTDKLRDSASVSDYRPIMSFAAGGAWIHGYRGPAREVQYAQERMPATTATAGN